MLDAAGSICKACGPRGLFTGYLPTLLEDVPDMACKFAAYETMRSLHRSFVGGRKASATVNSASWFNNHVQNAALMSVEPSVASSMVQHLFMTCSCKTWHCAGACAWGQAASKSWSVAHPQHCLNAA